MTLQTFENELDEIQLDKGFNFYKSYIIEECTEEKTDQWNALVRGSGYKVTVKLKDQDITIVTCNCPENIPYCKHIIATLYTIHYGQYSEDNKEIKIPSLTAAKAAGKPVAKAAKKPTKESLRELLNRIPEDEIREFIVSYAGEDKIFKNVFQAHFADKSILHGREAYATIIKRAISTIEDYRYNNIRKSMKPVETLLENAEEAFARKEYSMIVDIAFATIDKLHDFVEEMRGESRGGHGDCIEHAFKLLQMVVKAKITDELKQHIFEETIREDKKSKGHWFDGYWKDIMIAVAYNPELKARIRW